MSFFSYNSRSREMNGEVEKDKSKLHIMNEALEAMERIGGTLVEEPLQLWDAVYETVDEFTIQADEAPVAHRQHQYSREIAELLSRVSGWSYSDLETFQNQLSWLPLRGAPVLAWAYFYEFRTKNESLLVDATAQLILTHDRTTAIVSFRGTQLTNPWNWLADMSTKKVTLPGTGRVHLGFLRNFQAVWYGAKGIEQQLRAHAPTLQAVYLTGHSLGGALALLAGMTLQQHQEEDFSMWSLVRGIYTYGQPMVVDDRDRVLVHDRIGDRVFRHVYGNDVVPHLPPLSVGGYDHVGSEYRYDHHGGWKLRPEHTSSFGGKNRATQIVSALLVMPALGYDLVWDNLEFVLPFSKSPWSLADHNPGCYMDHW